MSDRRLIRYTGNDDWSALYVDGRLDRVGDHYLIDERIAELAGVTVVDDSAFMLGQNNADGVARTIEEIDAYTDRRERARRSADELRAEADRLRAEAEQLEGGFR